MSSLEIELQDLKEKNNELVKKVQYWKMTAAQKENEKLDLMKENNDLRLKLSRLRSGGAADARKLDADIQSASEQALTHLVQASDAVTRTVQLVKTYMQDRQETETSLPRWSSISNTPNNEKVHRVLPMLIGGQSIHPVVSLSRSMVNVNNLRTNRSPNNNQNRNFSERGPLPIHMLQDLYIPLTRIDANGLPVNSMDMDPDEENTDMNNSTEDLGFDDSGEQSLHESRNVSDADQFDESRRLDIIEEDLQPEDEVQPASKPRPTDNPLEGPSWMLDVMSKSRKTNSRVNLEPDSTTECDEAPGSSRAAPPEPGSSAPTHHQRDRLTQAFSPTVRRRKRTSSPRTPLSPHSPHSPRPPVRRNSNNGRILKVLVSKLRLEEDDVSPPKRPSLSNSPSRPGPSLARRESTDSSGKRYGDSPVTSPGRPRRDMQLVSFDAPSPNGATSSHVVVSETTSPIEAGGSGEPAAVARRISKNDSRASRDTKQDGRSSRDTKHDGRNSRNTKHDGRSSRDLKQERCSDTKQDSRGSHDSDSGSSSDPVTEGRTRRTRKAVTYKEKPLNRKMRR